MPDDKGFTKADVQNYADALLVSKPDLSVDQIAQRVRQNFKIKKLTISPVGRVVSDELADEPPAPPAGDMAGGMPPAGGAPPSDGTPPGAQSPHFEEPEVVGASPDLNLDGGDEEPPAKKGKGA